LTYNILNKLLFFGTNIKIHRKLAHSYSNHIWLKTWHNVPTVATKQRQPQRIFPDK